jgi:two-component SAPR family response regulator
MALLEDETARYCALLTDINLGSKLTGWDVAKRAREIMPEIPVVYMSGFADNEWTANGVPKSIMIAKPFAPAQVMTAVSQLLNGASS